MNRATTLTYEFVEHIPKTLEQRKLYICMSFATAVHKCCCGCGHEVVTPLSPTDWTLIFDGQTVSLDPSIGNWGFKCRSHYWITRSRVEWARRLSQREIDAGRDNDRRAKQRYFNLIAQERETEAPAQQRRQRRGLLHALRKWL